MASRSRSTSAASSRRVSAASTDRAAWRTSSGPAVVDDRQAGDHPVGDPGVQQPLEFGDHLVGPAQDHVVDRAAAWSSVNVTSAACFRCRWATSSLWR